MFRYLGHIDGMTASIQPSLLVKSFVWFADSLAGRSTLYCLSVLLLLFNTCLKKVSLLMVLSDHASCSSEHYQTVEKLVSEVQKKKKKPLKGSMHKLSA